MISFPILLGAIAGDMIGFRFEHNVCRDPRFTLFKKGSTFTDDTVLTLAVADAILNQRGYGEMIVEYAKCYPRAEYGSYFRCFKMPAQFIGDFPQLIFDSVRCSVIFCLCCFFGILRNLISLKYQMMMLLSYPHLPD